MEFMFQSSAGSGYTDERTANIVCYERLCVAIVKQAVVDLVHAYKRRDEYEARHIERFFRSEHFELLSGGAIDPDAVLRALRRKAKKR